MKFYTAVVFSSKTFSPDEEMQVKGGVDAIYSTIDEAIKAVESEIKRFRAYGTIKEGGFIHYHLDSKLSSELENRTDVYYTYRVNYGYGCYSIYTVRLQSFCDKHLHI